MKDIHPLQPKIVLAVVAHPDDIDVIAGGSLAKYVHNGATVFYYVLTNGNKGSDDHTMTNDELRDIRREEQRQAAHIIGTSDIVFGDYDDGCLECCHDVKGDIARVIRRVKPDTVVTFDPTVVYMFDTGMINHPDHRAAGQAALDAVFPLARDWRSFPEHETDEHLQPHKVKTVLLVNDDKATYFEDITEFFDTKLAALAAHKSQFSDIEQVHGFVRANAESMGARAAVQYAEGFVRLDLPL